MSASVLDLLSVVGRLPLSGDRGFVEAARLASANTLDDVAIRVLRRNLEGLGHVRRTFGAAAAVEVLNARWCLLPGGSRDSCTAVLTGARTASTADELNYLAATLAARPARDELGGGLPDRIALKASYQALCSLSSKLQVDIGSDPHTPDAWLLLQGMRSLAAQLRECMAGTVLWDDVSSVPPSFHAYNPSNGAFMPWPELYPGYSSALLLLRKAPYDYRLARRLNASRWRLFLKRLSLDPAWAMWAARLAAKPAEPAFPAPLTWTFRVPAACPLPLSLHQVCCLCSGWVPKRANGFIEYPDVPPIIQSGIIQRLSLGDLLQET